MYGCNVTYSAYVRASDSNEFYNITNVNVLLTSPTAIAVYDLAYLLSEIEPDDENRYDLTNYTRKSYDLRVNSKCGLDICQISNI